MHTETQAPTWLFTFGVNKLKVKQLNDDGSNFRFKVKRKHISDVALFSERPDRLTSQATSEQFKDAFDSIFHSDKPNASISYWNKGYHSSSFEMKTFKDSRNKDKYIIDISILDSSHDLSSSSTLQDVSFFVDSAWLCPAEELATDGLLCVY